jgi:hypothetical protein
MAAYFFVLRCNLLVARGDEASGDRVNRYVRRCLRDCVTGQSAAYLRFEIPHNQPARRYDISAGNRVP